MGLVSQEGDLPVVCAVRIILCVRYAPMVCETGSQGVLLMCRTHVFDLGGIVHTQRIGTWTSCQPNDVCAASWVQLGMVAAFD